MNIHFFFHLAFYEINFVFMQKFVDVKKAENRIAYNGVSDRLKGKTENIFTHQH